MSIFIIATVLLIALDQAVKYWAYTSLQSMHSIPLIDQVFHLTYVENRGAAFSLFASFDSRWIFVILAVLVSVAIGIAIFNHKIQTPLGCWSLILVAAGAIGNALDRIIYGFVVDLFDFCLINFPVFNVADIFICAGGFLFVLYVIFQHKDPENDAADQSSVE